MYISGYLDEKNTTVTTTPAPAGGQGSCALTGEYGGYLAKISKADGKCVWAKDTPRNRRAVSDDASVWAGSYNDEACMYDATHIITPAGTENDIFVAKYSAEDGTAHWATTIGGIGSERVEGMAMTSHGPMIMGYSDSPSFTMGSVEMHNLQHDFLGKKETEGAGRNGMFAVVLSPTDVNPPCITACPSGDVLDAGTTISANTCYADSACIADGARSPSRGCYKCESSKDQSVLTGPITGTGESHCYISGTCISRGTGAPTYARYGSNSVCETCNPDVTSDGWSLESGFFHDRDTASERSAGANDYGMYFASRSNGCQLLPDMPTPSTPSSDLIAANKNPTVGSVAGIGALGNANPTVSSVAGIGARGTNAISAVNGAAKDNQGAEIA